MQTTKGNILGLDEVLKKMEERTGQRNPFYEQMAKEIEEQSQVLESIANNIQSAFFNNPQQPRE